MCDARVGSFVLATGTYCLMAAAPLLLGATELPDRLRRFVDAAPAALLAALAAVATFAAGDALVIAARAAGLLAAGIALWRRAPFVLVVVIASAVTALFRALG